MRQPEISVILPVYNAAEYLFLAVNSILIQTFNNFEFIIINDGSTDNSENIIQSFKDDRIKYIKNNENRGLIYTLNKAIKESTGKYIARMDADDISIPNRLYEQKKWLDNHLDTAIVASVVKLINEKNQFIGYWDIDKKTLTHNAIKKVLAKENCIAHPSIMGKTEIFKQYLYKEYQQNIEDYDLWLRLISDGMKIDKIDQELLEYRIHKESVTKSFLQKKNFFFKHFNCKRKFLFYRIVSKKINWFDIKVFVQMVFDLARGIIKARKQILFK